MTDICLSNLKTNIMKKSFLVIPLFLFSLNAELNAQKVNEGVYLSANDYANGKISYAYNSNSKNYKLHANEIFCTSSMKIKFNDSVKKLSKDSIFGYRDKNNICHRFYNKSEFQIINNSENLIIYSKSTLEGNSRNKKFVTSYYFSKDAASAILPLTKVNLKTVYLKDLKFQEMINAFFDTDNELVNYDHKTQKYFLNNIYENYLQNN